MLSEHVDSLKILTFSISVVMIIVVIGGTYYFAYSLPANQRALQEQETQRDQIIATARQNAQDALDACNTRVVQYFATPGSYDINSPGGSQKFQTLMAVCKANNPVP